MVNIIEVLKAVVFGVVQGITEWLPISSTGHLILLNQFLNLSLSDDFLNMFKVVIQFGSILAVVVLYFNKLNPISPKKTPSEKKDTLNLWLKVIVGVIPAAIIGFLFEEIIDSYLSTPLVIALALILYGVAFIIIENKNKAPKIESLDTLTYKTAFLIGCFQVLALIPGTSRSGSTILGAVLIGASRGIASEFSFFLAIPVMLGASALKIIGFGLAFTPTEWAVLLTGTIVSFIVSIFAIKFLMNYI
ncbi:MAG: undecaprenyl-diphosphate phosphatase, partial [Clostridia bacterium]|nr:undecaprenyl-diphosphate phosphatase [Clostridia bacterium]